MKYRGYSGWKQPNFIKLGKYGVLCYAMFVHTYPPGEVGFPGKFLKLKTQKTSEIRHFFSFFLILWLYAEKCVSLCHNDAITSGNVSLHHFCACGLTEKKRISLMIFNTESFFAAVTFSGWWMFSIKPWDIKISLCSFVEGDEQLLCVCSFSFDVAGCPRKMLLKNVFFLFFSFFEMKFHGHVACIKNDCALILI